MRIPFLTFGAIASILTINSVMADTTVTSKQYVDTTRQATIPATGTNAATPGSTVVTYTNTAGTIGERGICDAGMVFCQENDLVTQDLLSDHINFLGVQIEQATNLPTTTTTQKVCTEWVSGQSHTDANCLLWNLVDQTVYGCRPDGASCGKASDCCGGICDGGVCASPQY